MKRILPWTLPVFLAIVLLPPYCRSEGSTDETFSEACRLVSSAREAEKRSYSEALGLYEKALGILEGITREYASSPAARKILTGYARVGPYTVAELERRVLPFARLRASAEKDPLVCAMIFAERSEGITQKIHALLRVADAFLQAGQGEKVAGVLLKALSAAQTIRDPSDRTRVLIDIAVKAAQAGGYDQALETAHAIDDPTRVPRALIDIARQCAKAEEAERVAEILSQALEAVETMKNADWQAPARLMIAATYAEAGLIDQALQLVEKAAVLAHLCRITATKFIPTRRIVRKPLAKPGARRNVLHPLVDGCAFF